MSKFNQTHKFIVIQPLSLLRYYLQFTICNAGRLLDRVKHPITYSESSIWLINQSLKWK